MMRRSALSTVVAALLLMAAPLTPGAGDEQQAWNHFLTWYKTYAGSPVPSEVRKAYSAALAAAGLSPAEVQARLAVVQNIGATSPPEMMTLHFNKIYREHPDVFSGEPNAFLVRVVRELNPGRALDVAMGQGRNSVFLARQGWDVTGYDLSDQGMAIARANAAKAGVKINTILASHQEFELGKDRWDLIVMTYAFVNMEDAAFLRRARDSLKPGGIVVVEQLNSGGTGAGPFSSAPSAGLPLGRACLPARVSPWQPPRRPQPVRAGSELLCWWSSTNAAPHETLRITAADVPGRATPGGQGTGMPAPYREKADPAHQLGVRWTCS